MDGRGDPRGAEALKGESTRDYVARQEKLKAEAKERMRAKFGRGGMGGQGPTGVRMGGVGSSSDYDPATGKYAGQRTGLQSLRQGDLSLDNAKDAALEAASSLKKFGAKMAKKDAVQDMAKTAKSTAQALARAASGGEFFELTEAWRKLVRQIVFSNDLPAPAISDLRTLTKFMSDRRKAADIFEDLRKALKPSPNYCALQRALPCVRHLVIHGPEHVVDRAWHLRREIQDLESYDSSSASLGMLRTRTDEGRFVREKAKELATLLEDFDSIRQLRADAARNTYQPEASTSGYDGGAAGRYDDGAAGRYSSGGGRRSSYDPDARDVPEPAVQTEPEAATPPVADLLDLNLDDPGEGFGAFEAAQDDGFAAFQGAAAPPDDGFASFQTAAPPEPAAFSAFPGAPVAPADDWSAFAAAAPPPPAAGFAPFGAAPPLAPGASAAERFTADGQFFSMGASPQNGTGLIPPPANGFPGHLPSPSALNASALNGPRAVPPRAGGWSSAAATEKGAFSGLLGGALGGGK
jgi:hypothetical protein